MRRFGVVCACFAGLAISATAAWAGDLFPPSPSNPLAPWNRGDPFTTTSMWHFGTSAFPADSFNSNPSISGYPQIQNPDGSSYMPPFTNPGLQFGPNGTWVIPAGGFIDFFIPNIPDFNRQKYIYLQIKFAGSTPDWGVTGSDGGVGHHYPNEPVVTPSPVSPNSSIYQWSDTLVLDHQPQFEIIHISNPAAATPCYLDQVVVDTICIPGPAPLAVLGLMGLAAARRRR